ncbi:MAG: Gfo/Idh/MocA family oxidoreductase [Candidatus Hydrogenedentota bacterium]
MERLRVGVIGCGTIFKKHLAVINSIKELGLIALSDLNTSLFEKFNRERPELKCYKDYIEMVNNEKLDIVCILTPSGTHSEIGINVSPYVRNLIIEKPLALTLKDADDLIRVCDKNSTRIFVVKQNRFNKPVLALRRAIESGRFGKLVLGTVRVRWCRRDDYYKSASWRGTWAMDGGVITNQAAHHIDLLGWLMGDVLSVKAYTTTRLAPIECEDTGVAILRFENGALGVIEATTATRPKDIEGSLSILGERGSVEIGGFATDNLKIWQFEKEEEEDEIVFKEWGKNPDEFAYNHKQFYLNILSSIKDNRKALIDGIEARKSLELINTIYESAESGKEVFLKFKSIYSKLGKKKDNERCKMQETR